MLRSVQELCSQFNQLVASLARAQEADTKVVRWYGDGMVVQLIRPQELARQSLAQDVMDVDSSGLIMPPAQCGM